MIARHPTAPRPGRRLGRRPGDGVEPVPAEVALAFHPRTLAQLLFVRAALRARRRDRPVPGRPRSRASSTARARATSRSSCRTPSAWRRATCAISRRGRASPPDATSSTASTPSSRLYRQRAAAERGRGPARRRARRAARGRARALRAAGLPDRARLVVTSPPYLRVVKYGYYNWLRTWFLGFDARADRRDARRRPPARAVLAFLREVLAGLRPRPGRRRGRGARHRRRRDGSGPADPRAASAWPRRPGSGAPSRRATGSPASSSTTSPPAAR